MISEERQLIPLEGSGQLLDSLEGSINSQSNSRTEGKISGRRVAAGMVMNAALGTAMLALTFFDFEELTSKNPDPIRVSAIQYSLGCLFRISIEANLALFKVNRSNLVEKVNNFLARFSWKIYLSLWNALLNVTDPTAGIVLNFARQFFIGFQLTGDAATVLKLDKRNRPTPNSEEKEIINFLYEPAVDNPGGQFLSGCCKTALGVSFIGSAYLFESAPSPLRTFFKCIGCFLATQGIGYGVTDWTLSKWRAYEKELKDKVVPILDGDVDDPPLPLKIRVLRTGTKTAQRVATEIICSLPYFFSNSWGPFIPLGLLYGSITRFTLEKFGSITQEDLKTRASARLVANSSTVRTEVRVNQVATAAFFLLFTAWFSYGFVASNDDRERIEIATLMFFTYSSAGLARLLNYLFKPGTHSRAFNQFCYQILYNPYLSTILYQTATQLTEVNDETLDKDSFINYLIGLFGLANLGVILGTDQVKDYNPQELSSSVFRAVSFFDILWNLRGSG
jgi:hypothetical protein